MLLRRYKKQRLNLHLQANLQKYCWWFLRQLVITSPGHWFHWTSGSKKWIHPTSRHLFMFWTKRTVECKCLQFSPTLQAPSKECIFSESVLRIDHYEGRNIKTDIWYRYTSVKMKILVPKFKYSLSIISGPCSYFVSVASTLIPPPFNAINHDMQLLDHAVGRILKREEN